MKPGFSVYVEKRNFSISTLNAFLKWKELSFLNKILQDGAWLSVVSKHTKNSFFDILTISLVFAWKGSYLSGDCDSHWACDHC